MTRELTSRRVCCSLAPDQPAWTLGPEHADELLGAVHNSANPPTNPDGHDTVQTNDEVASLSPQTPEWMARNRWRSLWKGLFGHGKFQCHPRFHLWIPSEIDSEMRLDSTASWMWSCDALNWKMTHCYPRYCGSRWLTVTLGTAGQDDSLLPSVLRVKMTHCYPRYCRSRWLTVTLGTAGQDDSLLPSVLRVKMTHCYPRYCGSRWLTVTLGTAGQDDSLLPSVLWVKMTHCYPRYCGSRWHYSCTD